ncbi:hypothetical protein [Rhizobium sp. 11_C7_N12_5]|uniref:hypothetical protein n=1 Tax=Rhizobium sp. 11_C7_N12_5 TaxID=3240770 RepID=UPI003F22BFDE
MKITIVAVLAWLFELVGAGAADEYGMRSAAAAEWQATWAFLAMIVSLGSLGVSGVALYFLFKSLQQTRSALDVTQSLGQAQARAYIEASDVQFSDDTGCILVTCKNSGQTPSPFVAIGLEAVSTTKVNMDHALKGRAETPLEKSWAALGAGGEFTAKLTPRTGQSSVQDWFRMPAIKDQRMLVYGMIIYSDVFNQYFKTEFAFFTHRGVKSDKFLRPHGFHLAYKELTSEEYNRWLGKDV